MKHQAQIFRLARFRLGRYLLSGLFASSLTYLFPLIPGLIVRSFLDALTGSTRAGLDPWSLLALLVAAAVGRLGGSAGAVFFEESTQLLVAALLRRNVLRQILEQPGARPLPSSTGEAISRFRDDVQYVVNFLTWTMDPVGQIAVLVVVLTVFIRIDSRMTIFVILPIVFVVLGVRLATRRLTQYRASTQEALGNVTSLLGDVFDGALAIKAAGAEQNVVAHLRDLNEARRKAALRDLVLSQTLLSAASNAGDLGTGVLLLVAAQAMRAGTFTVGDFALVVSYLSWLTIVTSAFGEFLSRSRQTEVSIDRLLALIPTPEPLALSAPAPVLPGEFPPLAMEPGSPSGDSLQSLEVRGLSLRYSESGRGVSGVSFHLRPGELVVVTGRVGSGKTTLLRALLGLLPGAEGEILWNGRRILDPGRFMVPPRVAYTSQVPRLFSETLADNIRLGQPADEVCLSRAIRLAAFDADVATLEHGMETIVGARGARLSGGQVQRAAAARALIRQPDLLVVDDLSSALDVETEQRLWNALLAEDGLTCLAVSHRPAVLRRAARILVLDEGCLLSVGTVEDLLEECVAFRSLWLWAGGGGA